MFFPHDIQVFSLERGGSGDQKRASEGQDWLGMIGHFYKARKQPSYGSSIDRRFGFDFRFMDGSSLKPGIIGRRGIQQKYKIQK